MPRLVLGLATKCCEWLRRPSAAGVLSFIPAALSSRAHPRRLALIERGAAGRSALDAASDGGGHFRRVELWASCVDRVPLDRDCHPRAMGGDGG